MIKLTAKYAIATANNVLSGILGSRFSIPSPGNFLGSRSYLVKRIPTTLSVSKLRLAFLSSSVTDCTLVLFMEIMITHFGGIYKVDIMSDAAIAGDKPRKELYHSKMTKRVFDVLQFSCRTRLFSRSGSLAWNRKSVQVFAMSNPAGFGSVAMIFPNPVLNVLVGCHRHSPILNIV